MVNVWVGFVVERGTRRLKDEQHTTEFASTLVGPETTNPYDRKRTPGGSSSGSAAAVRDFQAQITFGTQTAGMSPVELLASMC